MATVSDRKRLRFTPAVGFKPKNSIVSSIAASKNNKGFIPSYEKDKSIENMHWIMQMEYHRIWFNELKTFEKITYTRKNSCSKDAQISRKYVMKSYRAKENPLALPPIKVKKFQNIKSRIDNHNYNPPKREGLDRKIELPGFNVPIVININKSINETQMPKIPDNKALSNERKKPQDKKEDGEKVAECGKQIVCPKPCQQCCQQNMPDCSNMMNICTCCK